MLEKLESQIEALTQEVKRAEQSKEIAEHARDRWKNKYEDFVNRVHNLEENESAILELSKMRQELEEYRMKCHAMTLETNRMRRSLLHAELQCTDLPIKHEDDKDF